MIEAIFHKNVLENRLAGWDAGALINFEKMVLIKTLTLELFQTGGY